MSIHSVTPSKMPGPSAPAFLRLLSLAAVGALALGAAPAFAQSGNSANGLPPATPPQTTVAPALAGVPPAAIRPVPDQLQLAKLIWSTMAAVDQANRSGNYSVLRDISATGFQINNDPSRLATVFAAIRSARIDLSSALLVPPTYPVAPQQIQADVFRVQGLFNLRPIAIAFDLYFQWDRGEWRLFGIDLRPLPMNESIDAPPRPGGPGN